MKRILILSLLILAAAAGFAQGTATKENKDSLASVQAGKVVNQIVETTPVKEFDMWLFKNWTAEKYNEFVQVYNVFVQEKYKEYLLKKVKEK